MGFYIWFCFKDLVYYCKESCTNHIRANYYSPRQNCTCFLTVLWQRINHQTGNMQDLHGESTRLTYISVLSNMLLLRLCAYINIKKCVSWILKKGGNEGFKTADVQCFSCFLKVTFIMRIFLSIIFNLQTDDNTCLKIH